MSEQAPQSNEKLVRSEEPDTYVSDPAKAEVMAYASKGKEEEVVSERNAALAAASSIGSGSFYDQGRILHPETAANRHAELAEQARQEADEQAQSAANIYDRVKNL